MFMHKNNFLFRRESSTACIIYALGFVKGKQPNTQFEVSGGIGVKILEVAYWSQVSN